MKRYSPAKTLRRFGFRQTVRGALIIAVIGGLMMGAYGTAIVKVYPTEQSRQALVQTLSATPAINFLSGEVKDAGTPASYSIYKSLPMMVLVTSIWGLMVATRLLRGAEEDGRLEALVSGAVTRRQAAGHQLVGFGYSIVLAIVVMWALAAALGAAPGVNLTPVAAFYMTLAVFLPGIVFASVGAFTSQLALTRGKAVMYGLVPLLVFYCIRGVANTNDQLNWLKAVSPFGWSDLINSVLDPQLLWIIPSAVCTVAFTVAGLYFVPRRDFGTSLLHQKTEVRSRFYLLTSPLAFTLRQKKWTYFWWLIATVAVALFMAALAGLVTNIIHGNNSLGVLSAISPDTVKLLFIGESFMIFSLILLAMTILEMVSIRREEAKLYLDNFLVQPIRRRVWLTQRLFLMVVMAIVVAALSTLAIWTMARVQQVNFSVTNAIDSGIAVMGGLVLVAGVGAFLYGLWPRIAVVGMAIVVGWAFVIDILQGLFHLQDWVQKTSVLHYLPIDPTKSVEWTGIIWMIAMGILLAAIGIFCFSRRDIISE
ncbi:MAG TPA: ABC transporter permease subunit [Dongiaceae bacterium]|nr:ABC transporter permease subunit [Dongiaceae bacterium]